MLHRRFPSYESWPTGRSQKEFWWVVKSSVYDIWARDIWAQTFGREDIWVQRHLGARHLGAKCVLAHFQQSFSTSSKKIFCKNFIFSTVLVSVLIFSNFLITTSNKRTNRLMYITET